MKALEVIRSRNSNLFPLVLTLTIALPALAAVPQQLILSRDSQPTCEVKGVFDVVVSPGFDDARVSIALDGQKIADNVLAPYHIQMDFGALPLEHKITVTAVTSDRKRVQWQTLLNKGHQPLTIKVTPSNIDNREFEATVTAPENDPVNSVTFWDNG